MLGGFAQELRPDQAASLVSRGVAKDNLADFRGAILDFDKSILLYPSYSIAYLNRAISERHLGNTTNAFKDFDKALELKEDAEVYYNLGAMKSDMKNYVEAIENGTRTLAVLMYM